jgi:hypothetical protein
MSTCGDLGWKARPSAAVLGPFAFPAIPQEGPLERRFPVFLNSLLERRGLVFVIHRP